MREPSDDEDGPVLPLALGGIAPVAATPAHVLTVRMREALEASAAAAAALKTECTAVHEAVQQLRDAVGHRSSGSRTRKALVALLEDLGVRFDGLRRFGQEHSNAVDGLKEAFLRDVSDGAAPPLALKEALMYGVATMPVCPTCGRVLDTPSDPQTEDLIARFMFKGITGGT